MASLLNVRHSLSSIANNVIVRAAFKPYATSFSRVQVAAPVTNFSQTRSYFSSASKLAKLKRDADNNLDDSNKQLSLFKELNRDGRSRDVIVRYEKGGIATNEKITYEYLVALSRSNRLTPSKLASLTPSKTTTQEMQQQNTSGGPVISIPNRITFDNSVPLKVETFQKYSLAGVLLRLGLTVALVAYLLYGTNSIDPTKALGMNAGTNKLQKNTNVKFSDVKGVDEAKEQLVDIVEYLKNPKKFSALGGKLPKGVLLYGPPGTGKTLLAKAVAGEAGVPFFYAAGSEFDEVFVGLGARRVRNLFSEAKKHAPCIIFLDEIETVGASRKKTINLGNRDGTINQLLTELDGFVENSGVIVIAATNFPEALDSALTRPGRFDKLVSISPPDKKGRRDILDLYLKKITHDKNVNADVLARATIGFTGADLYNLVNLSALKAAKLNLPAVTMKVMEDSLDDVRMGVAVLSKTIPMDNRKLTAYHEAGHALVSMYTTGSDPIHKATILPRGPALGMVAHLPQGDSYHITKQQILAKIAVCMGGRAAEELIYGAQGITGGASSDFEQATKNAQMMVTRLGMGESTGFKVYKEAQEASEDTRKKIDDEVERILKTQYDYAKQLLQTREKELHNLAQALLEHETLDEEEIKQVVAGKKLKTANLQLRL